MPASWQKICAVAAASLALVAVALAIRLSRTVPLSAIANLVTYPWSHGISIPGSPDSSFYESGKAPSSGGDRQAANGPQVTAQAYLVGNVETGAIYATRNASEVLPVASMSKLITAIASTDTLMPTTTILITPQEYDVASDTSRIAAGERFTVKEILYPLLLNSSNVAAEALASSSNRVKFLTLMSSYAWEIGMPSTFFADPSGISPLNQSSARDFFALARYLYKSRPDILAITRVASTSVATTTDHGAHDFVSIHPFVKDPNFIGGKTGHTPEAHDTMLTIMDIGGQPVAIVVLSSEDRKADTALLRNEAAKILAR